MKVYAPDLLRVPFNIALRAVCRLRYRYVLERVGRDTVFGGLQIKIIGGRRRNGDGISIGDQCNLWDGCILISEDVPGSGILIGDNSHFNFGCYLAGVGGLTIGSNCLFGPGVKVLTGGHAFADVNVPIIDQGPSSAPVVIEDNVWVGAGAIVLPGVRVETGAVVAAGAVVTANVGRNTVVAGVPATLKAVRARDLITEAADDRQRDDDVIEGGQWPPRRKSEPGST